MSDAISDATGRYAGARVVIIGGTSGIGRATALLLADGGARVLIFGRSAGEGAREQTASEGATVDVIGDLTSADDVERLAARTAEALGQIDLLVVTAGITRNRPFDEVDEALYDDVFAVNSKGPYFAVQRLAGLLAGGAAVVLTTSVSGVLGQPSASVYAASKAALRSMARTLARELQPRGVRVNAVSPGPTDTGILDRSMAAEAAAQLKRQMAASNPMQRFASPDEVARAIAFMGLEATFTTGAELPVDGGVSQL